MCYDKRVKRSYEGDDYTMFHQNPTNYISHVTLRVQDLDKVSAFYKNVLGFTTFEETPTKIVLGTTSKALLTLKKDKAYHRPKEARAGLYHVAYLLPNRLDLSRFIHHLVKLNIRFGGSDHHVSEAIYLSDPEGNGIEVYIDKDPTRWLWHQDQVFMSVDPLDYDDLLNLTNDQESFIIPDETLIGHIHLQVADLSKAEAFYTEKLGFKVVARYGKEALFLSDNHYHHHIGINTWQGTKIKPLDPLETGLDSFEIHVGNQEKIKLDTSFSHQDPAANNILFN
jgi:catechol 2,3-dioxygenase